MEKILDNFVSPTRGRSRSSEMYKIFYKATLIHHHFKGPMTAGRKSVNETSPDTHKMVLQSMFLGHPYQLTGCQH